MNQGNRSLPWYRADASTNFDLRSKILAEGCRDPYRMVLECRNQRVNDCES